MKNRFLTQADSQIHTQKLFLRSIRLLPVLARRGVAPADALAVAFNAAYLSYRMPQKGFPHSPKSLLKKYSYAEIASLCEHLLGTAEFGINESYKEVLP